MQDSTASKTKTSAALGGGTIVTEQSWPPMAVALLRGALIGTVLAGVNLFASLQLDYSVRDCFVSAGLVLFTNLAAAMGVGSIDSANAKRGA